jgi:catechol 2,3-dioxygenase-like lactoylglutathione lyase family enzyme
MAISILKQSSSFASEMGLKLTHNILRVKNPSELIQFYVNNFGMKKIEISTPSLAYNVCILGYTTNYDENFNVASNTLPPPTFLEFHYDNSSTTNPSLVNSGSSNIYWKIGITTHDVDYAREILQSKKVNIGQPSQFEDIGYVCHLRDPNGFIIELLQHDFQETFKAKMNKSGRKPLKDHFPLGYPSCIGQITLHANDIDKTQWFYQDLLGMKLLSVQEATQYGFTLYFFAWTNENPPKPDVKDASTNREWLWKRPYTTIEIRHFHNQGQITPFRDLKQNEIGFKGIRIMCNDLNMFIDKMKAEKINFQESNGTYGKEIIIRDPDNIPIHVSQNKNEQ